MSRAGPDSQEGLLQHSGLRTPRYVHVHICSTVTCVLKNIVHAATTVDVIKAEQMALDDISGHTS
jgi:hypothetical protein